jgi:hypothetical protein
MKLSPNYIALLLLCLLAQVFGGEAKLSKQGEPETQGDEKSKEALSQAEQSLGHDSISPPVIRTYYQQWNPSYAKEALDMDLIYSYDEKKHIYPTSHKVEFNFTYQDTTIGNSNFFHNFKKYEKYRPSLKREREIEEYR